MNNTITITYDSENKNARHLVNYIKSLDFLNVEKAKLKKTGKKNSLDRSLDDIMAGRVFEAKDGKDLIKQCLE